MNMFVITHKVFYQNLPKGYVKLLVGAQNKSGDYFDYLKDNQGDNISNKNKNYCELTGLYWIWKNVNEKHVGLSHYRRYFTNTGNNAIISIEKLNDILNDCDWVAATPEDLGYWHFKKRSVYKQYELSHYIKDLKVVREIISEKYPEYLDAFDRTMGKSKFSPYNMFYTSKDSLNQYCSWLFDILFEAEKRIDISTYDSYQSRIFGFLSERLFNVYLEHNKFNIKYLDVMNTEKVDEMQKSLLGNIAHLVRWH